MNITVEITKAGTKPWSRTYLVQKEGDVEKAVNQACDEWRRAHPNESLFDHEIRVRKATEQEAAA